jgi:hypothetical protein
VNYEGVPVEKGVVNFVPEGGDANARSATGAIEGGYYSLMTLTPGDGAFPGKYKVVVLAREDPDMEKVKAETQARLRAIGKAGDHGTPPELVGRAQKEAKPRVPEKYANPQTSDLTAEVKAESNTIPLELSGDLKPVVPDEGSSPRQRSRGRGISRRGPR